jgi:5-aminolevulinate synthase
MGPALVMRSGQMVAGYASVAGQVDVQNIHHSKGIFPGTTVSEADIAKCPHASAARAAARMADDLAAASAAKTTEAVKETPSIAQKAAAAGCPFHKAAAVEEPAKLPDVKEKQATATAPDGFNYDNFYAAELEKKHKDQSYRYFNNINRLANKFPVAHTANVNEEVQVWCANDYLGMGNNPVVLETMQYVSPAT